MHSGDLSSDQLKKLYDQLRPMSDFLYRLQTRMDETGFSKADTLYTEVVAARSTMLLLSQHVHKLACGPSYPVGR